MKNIIIKIVCGILFSIIGFALFTILMNYVSGAGNNISFDFMRSVQNYFSAFSYGLGVVGAIFGAVILIEIIGIFFLSGFWISEKMFFRKDQVDLENFTPSLS